MKGAFLSKGLPESRAEKREKAELAELAAFDAPPRWATPSLLNELRARATKENVTAVAPAAAPFDLSSVLAHAVTVCKYSSDSDPTWWAALAAAPAGATERLVLCLGQDGEHRLRAAAAWWPAACIGEATPMGAADASKIVLIEDTDGTAQPAIALGHPTVIGVGAEGAPTPASHSMCASRLLHLAEGVRLHLLAKSQVSARLQRGGAATDEKALVKLFLREATHRLSVVASVDFASSTVGDASEPVELNKCESAVAGLRKIYLPRNWAERCLECGTRHSVVESGTCKFWRRWTAEARDREAAEAAGAPEAVEAAEAAEPVKMQAEESVGMSVDGGAEAHCIKGDRMPAAVAEGVEVDAPKAQADAPVFEPFMPKLRMQAARAAAEDKENVTSGK